MSSSAKTQVDSFLSDHSQLNEQLKLLHDPSLEIADPACTRLCSLLDNYLQLSTLLDPILPTLVPTLCTLAHHRLSTFTSTPSSHSKWSACRLTLLPFIALYTAAKVRGVKPMSRRFPHQVQDLQTVIRHINFIHTSCNPVRFWHARYVLFSWAAVAIQLPFPLLTVLHPPQLAAAITAARAALEEPGPASTAATSFLARLVARRDAVDERHTLLAWAVGTTLREDATSPIRIAGLSLLAAVFKFSHRDDLRPHVMPVREALRPLQEHTEACTTREAHLISKLSARLALSVLPPRMAPWRYNRGRRVVFERSEDGVAKRKGKPSIATAGHIGAVEDSTGQQETIDDDALETLEAVVEVLLISLQHEDTIVRWSAAKGVGRVTARLPLSFAQDVVDSVIELFGHASEARADAAWQGGCLALAELARRGLLLPQEPQFPMSFDVIGKAASFDLRRGANSVGAHVRDAACYAVWAMARAYSKEDVEPFASKITDAMLPVALLDREINCRRAAAAALQECVGRLSERLFRDGIQLITIADYFSLGDRVAAYLSIAPKVASLADGEYFDCILLELTDRKLVHWDPVVRSLASKSLAGLIAVDKENVILRCIVPELLRRSAEKGDVVARHGAILGLAEIAIVAGTDGFGEVVSDIRALPKTLKESKSFSGRTGDEMRMACCHLIESLAKGAGYTYAASKAGRGDAEYALEFVESIFGSGKEDMYRKATSAYAAICNDVIANDVEWHVNVTRRILKGMSKKNAFTHQRGFALAAGVCGDSAVSLEVVDVLCREIVGNADVEVRRNSAISLSRVSQRMALVRIQEIFIALSKGMSDYATDERGDVGSWVREASMRASSDIVERLFNEKTNPSLETIRGKMEPSLIHLLRGITAQCCGRIDRTRVVAGSSLTAFCNIFVPLDNDLQISSLCRELAACFGIPGKGSEEDGKSPVVSFGEAERVFPAVCSALNIEGVCDAVLVGLVSAGGGMGHQSRAALHSLVECFRNITEISLKRKRFLSIVQVIEGGQERLMVPTFTVLEALVAQKALSDIGSAELIHLAKMVRASWRQKLRNVKRTAAAVHLLAELASLSLVGHCFDFREGSLGRECLEAFMVVLGGPIPRLRQITAECLYLTLIDYAGNDDDDLDDEEKSYIQKECPTVNAALDLLMETKWTQLETSAAREQRNFLCKLLKIKQPVPRGRIESCIKSSDKYCNT